MTTAITGSNLPADTSICVIDTRRRDGSLRSRSSQCLGLALAVVAILSVLQACSTPERLAAVPKEQQTAAVVGGMSGIRYWQKADLASLQKDGIDAFERESALFAATGNKGPLPTANYLAISGGGEDGAFGAGLLVGWTEAGTRPEFKLVTGISTGALTAPFAFLGPDYDRQLKEVYTNITAKDVLEERSILAAVFDDALADNAPLRRLVARYVTQDMLEAIAAENAKGRILLIATTNLDARRPVIWNIGKIAASGNPNALELVRSLLVASVSWRQPQFPRPFRR
jgi:hypothetical protein